MSIFLGIDIGTSGTKTLAINAKGKILGEASETYPIYHPKPLWSEQDPEDWWQATVKTVRAVVKKAKLKPADVKAITARCFWIRTTAWFARHCFGTISGRPPNARKLKNEPAVGRN